MLWIRLLRQTGTGRKRRVSSVSRRGPLRQALLILAVALGIRLLFALITADSYDPDEFVILTLSRDFAHGAVPYHSFTFFHPPGILVLFRTLEPIIRIWWPLGRGVTIFADAITAVLVWFVGRRVLGPRQGLAAAVLYAVNPIAVFAGVHIGQDTLLTTVGFAGLAILVASDRWSSADKDEARSDGKLGGSRVGSANPRGRFAAVLAGVCLATGVWLKYPGLIFLPVYLLAARDRFVEILLGMAVGLAALFAYFQPELSPMLAQSVGWQMIHREANDPVHRLAGTLAFWLLLNPVATAAALMWLRNRWRGQRGEGLMESHTFESAVVRRTPAWVVAGFALGGLFVFGAQVYYHYFVPVVPFGALLAAPLMVSAWDRRHTLSQLATFGERAPSRVLLGIPVVLLACWSIALNLSPARSGLALQSFGQLRETLRTLNQVSRPNQALLTDEFEYAYLDNRPLASPYFWDMSAVTRPRALERHLSRASAVINAAEDGYPEGFTEYLRDQGYRKLVTPGATIWVK